MQSKKCAEKYKNNTAYIHFEFPRPFIEKLIVYKKRVFSLPYINGSSVTAKKASWQSKKRQLGGQKYVTKIDVPKNQYFN